MPQRSNFVFWKFILPVAIAVSFPGLAQEEQAPDRKNGPAVEPAKAEPAGTNLAATAQEPAVTNLPPAKRLENIPIIIEKATTRGRVIMLEDTNTDREVVEGVLVAVWYIDEESRERLVYQTKTDKDGMFSLPELKEGIYRTVVGVTPMLMQVIPPETKLKEQERAAPKTLLILMPKQAI